MVFAYTHSHGQTRLLAFGDQREPARATQQVNARLPLNIGCIRQRTSRVVGRVAGLRMRRRVSSERRSASRWSAGAIM